MLVKTTLRRVCFKWANIKVICWKENFSGSLLLHNGHATSNRRQFDGDITLIRRIEKISTSLNVISTYLFNVILMWEKLTSWRCTFFDVVSMTEKSTLFGCILLSVISMGKKSTTFGRTLFDLISMGKKIDAASIYFLM